MPNRTFRTRPWRRRGQNYYPASKSHKLITITGSGGAVVGGSADRAFFHGTFGADSNIEVLVDWDHDDAFTLPEEDISEFVLSVNTRTGRDWPSLLTGSAGPGDLKMLLNNHDNRFSRFQSTSPLNTPPLSMNTGGKVRIQEVGTPNPDPATLSKDLFRRDDSGSLGSDESGNLWSQPLTGTWGVSNLAAIAQNINNDHLACVESGSADYYVQATISPGSLTNKTGIAFRIVDSTNYSLLYVDAAAGNLTVANVVAGVVTPILANSIEVYAGITIGVLIDDTSGTIYLEGVSSATFTAINTSATQVGIFANWGTGDTAPTVDSFYAWEHLISPTDGILWTGDFNDLTPEVQPGPEKVANMVGEGWLSKMANQTITPPTSVTGRRTGLLLGAVLAQAGLLTPPGPIDLGDVVTGPFAMAPTSALEVARRVEQTEFGFLHETPEGPPGMGSRTARDGLSPVCEFSDDPGAQFCYDNIAMQDWHREVFNQVTAGVSPYALGVEAVLYTDPGPYVLAPGESVTLAASYSGSGVVTRWTGHTRQVAAPQPPSGITVPVSFGDSFRTSDDSNATYSFNIALPTTTDGDLLLFIGCTGTLGPPWDGDEPSGWTMIHKETYSRPFVLAKIANGDESANHVVINMDYDSNSSQFAYNIYRVTNWFGDLDGSIQVLGTVQTSGVQPNPPAITPVWGAIPTLFIACSYSTGGGPSAHDYTAVPTGYTLGAENNDGSTRDSWLGFCTAYKVTTTTTEDPGAFTGNAAVINGATTQVFTFTVAVRGSAAPIPVTGDTPAGSNPSFVVPYDNGVGGTTQSVTDIEVTGIPLLAGDDVSVRADDFDSQESHRAIRTYPYQANLFASTSDALIYANLVLSKHAEDRPILVIGFSANKSEAYRQQALKRRVGDMIYVTADNDSGLGIRQEFIIETISHEFTEGTKKWYVTWQLSPA